MQVSEPSMQHKVMIEAVENHMPEVIIIDEIGTDAEVRACRTIAQRGVMLIGSAHGKRIEDVIKNPTLCDLVRGIFHYGQTDSKSAILFLKFKIIRIHN